jgi:hypothetical protein
MIRHQHPTVYGADRAVDPPGAAGYLRCLLAARNMHVQTNVKIPRASIGTGWSASNECPDRTTINHPVKVYARAEHQKEGTPVEQFKSRGI